MRLLPLIAVAILLAGCHKNATQELAQSLHDGTKDPNKGIIILGLSFHDGFRTHKKSSINACLNLREKPKENSAYLVCDALINVEDLKGGESKEKMMRIVGIDRRKVSIDGFSYSYNKGEDDPKTYVRIFYVDNPPSQMLAHYGDTAYVGDFHLSTDEDIETEKPRLHIQFKNDYAGFKEFITKKYSAKNNRAFDVISSAVNLPLSGYAKPLKISTEDKDYTAVYSSPTIIYVPKYR